MNVRSLVLAPIAALAVCVGAHATTFGLEGSVGSTPTFSVTSGGNTATYTSGAGNGFAVQSTAGLLTFGTALLDSNFFGTDPLTITFSQQISGSLVIPFALLDSFATTDTLVVTSNTNQSATFLGVPDALALAEPEGVATFVLTAPVSSITLTSNEPLAIGDLSTVAPTPEPASIALLATGVAGLAVRRRRA